MLSPLDKEIAICYKLLLLNAIFCNMLKNSRKIKKVMIGNTKRRFYRFSLAAAICLLGAFVLYDLQKVDFTNLVFAVATISMFVGVALFFKGFMALADPDKYDRFEEVFPGRQYAPRFYAIALGVFLMLAFLLIWTIIMGAPNPQDEGMLAFGLAVMAGCLAIGRSSQNI